MAMKDLLRLLAARFVSAGPLQWFLMVLLVLWLALIMVAPRGHHLPPLLARPTGGHARAWFDCFDCRRGELDSVIALVGRRPLVTTALLGGVLRNGPNAADSAAFADGLRRTHARTAAWLAVRDPTTHLPPEDAYVADRLRLFDRAWRVRAAIALGRVIEVAPSLGAVSGAEAFLDAACADQGQTDVVVLRQVIWARLATDTLASVLCRLRANAYQIPLLP
jgi:hypothetical protein